jgi:hypothetical protein
MALLHKFTQMVYAGRLIPKVIKAELSNLDSRISTNESDIGTIESALESLDALTEQQSVYIPADAAASDTFERAIFKAPAACTVSEVIVVPDSDIGQATDYMTLDVQDKGADGTGTTSIGSLNVNSEHTIEGMVGLDLVETDATVASARVLSIKKTVTASGQAWPGGTVITTFTPTGS